MIFSGESRIVRFVVRGIRSPVTGLAFQFESRAKIFVVLRNPTVSGIRGG